MLLSEDKYDTSKLGDKLNYEATGVVNYAEEIRQDFGCLRETEERHERSVRPKLDSQAVSRGRGQRGMKCGIEFPENLACQDIARHRANELAGVVGKAPFVSGG